MLPSGPMAMPNGLLSGTVWSGLFSRSYLPRSATVSTLPSIPTLTSSENVSRPPGSAFACPTTAYSVQPPNARSSTPTVSAAGPGTGHQHPSPGPGPPPLSPVPPPLSSGPRPVCLGLRRDLDRADHGRMGETKVGVGAGRVERLGIACRRIEQPRVPGLIDVGDGMLHRI